MLLLCFVQSTTWIYINNNSLLEAPFLTAEFLLSHFFLHNIAGLIFHKCCLYAVNSLQTAILDFNKRLQSCPLPHSLSLSAYKLIYFLEKIPAYQQSAFNSLVSEPQTCLLPACFLIFPFPIPQDFTLFLSKPFFYPCALNSFFWSKDFVPFSTPHLPFKSNS